MESNAWLNALSTKNAENLDCNTVSIDVPTGSNTGQAFTSRKDGDAAVLESLAASPVGTNWDTEFATSTSVKEAWSPQPIARPLSDGSNSIDASEKDRAQVDVNIKDGNDERLHSFSGENHPHASLDNEACDRTDSASVMNEQHDGHHDAQAWGESVRLTPLDKESGSRGTDGWCALGEPINTDLPKSPSSNPTILVSTACNLTGKGISRIGADDSQQCVIEDLEKDSPTGLATLSPNRSETVQSSEIDCDKLNGVTNKMDSSGVDLPKVMMDGLGTPRISNARKLEDASETRRRKLKIKMKHSNAFKSLFRSTRLQAMNSSMDMSMCYNPEGIKIAKTSPHRGTYVLSRSSMKSVNETDSKLLNYGLAAESKQYMAPSESIKIMKETLDEKRQYYFGEQTWLLGRLALSKETSRFELPMDLRIMEKLSPMRYLTGYCVICSRRKSLYKSIFQKVDKDRDGFIAYTDLIRAVKEIHVQSIDENEVGELSKILALDDSSDAKYNCAMFAGVAAFSERLVIYLRSMCGKVEHSEKNKLESADFDNMKWKLRSVNVNPALMNVLQVL